ncbi:MAG: hypothetical protein Q7T52_07880, partial [Nocardioides sp.]|nr:hypothetical protein [Nocardioides sp.]
MNDRGLSIFDEEPDETESATTTPGLQKGGGPSGSSDPDAERTQVIPATPPAPRARGGQSSAATTQVRPAQPAPQGRPVIPP